MEDLFWLSIRIIQSYLRYFGLISRRTNGLEKLFSEGMKANKWKKIKMMTRLIDKHKRDHRRLR